jgi:hypothetical protein
VADGLIFEIGSSKPLPYTATQGEDRVRERVVSRTLRLYQLKWGVGRSGAETNPTNGPWAWS